MTEAVEKESIWRRWVVRPVMGQLTQGVEPGRLAQAVAVGVTTGLFPLPGTTILLALAVSLPLRLNQPILHLFRELVYPLHLASILLFMRAGEKLFGVPHVPLSLSILKERFAAGPGQFFIDFGMLGLYAVAVWALLAPVLGGAVYVIARPLLRRLSRRIATATAAAPGA